MGITVILKRFFERTRLQVHQNYFNVHREPLKENKHIWSIRLEYNFAVYTAYANQHKSEHISANFRPK